MKNFNTIHIYRGEIKYQSINKTCQKRQKKGKTKQNKTNKSEKGVITFQNKIRTHKRLKNKTKQNRIFNMILHDYDNTDCANVLRDNPLGNI